MIVYYASIDKLLMLTTTTDLQFFRTYYKKSWQDSRATSTYITLHVSMTSPQPKLQKNVTQQTFMVLCLLVQIPFFLSGFSFTTIHKSQDGREKGRTVLTSD